MQVTAMIALMLALMCLLGPALWVEAAPLVPLQTDLIRHVESQTRHLKRLSLDADSLHSYDQIALSLDYRVEDAAVPMTGHAYLTIVDVQPQTQISFNCEGITVEQVSEHGSTLPFAVQNDTLYITRSLQSHDTATFDIQVSVPVHTDPNGVYGFQLCDQPRLHVCRALRSAAMVSVF